MHTAAPLTTSCRKRKAPHESSDNPGVVKACKHNSKLSQGPIEDKINKAKAADQSAVTYIKNVLKKSRGYSKASENQKQEIERACVKDVTVRRYIFYVIIPIIILILFYST
jgi:hypothetical protein